MREGLLGRRNPGSPVRNGCKRQKCRTLYWLLVETDSRRARDHRPHCPLLPPFLTARHFESQPHCPLLCHTEASQFLSDESSRTKWCDSPREPILARTSSAARSFARSKAPFRLSSSSTFDVVSLCAKQRPSILVRSWEAKRAKGQEEVDASLGAERQCRAVPGRRICQGRPPPRQCARARRQ